MIVDCGCSTCCGKKKFKREIVQRRYINGYNILTNNCYDLILNHGCI